MSDGWAGVVGEFHQERSVRLARQAGQRDDRQAERDEAERRARLDDERDRRLLQAHLLGQPGRSLADLTSAASRAADEDDAYAEARKTIERIDKRRAARREAARFEAEQMSALAARSEVRDLLQPAKEAARLRVEEMLRSAPPSRPVSRSVSAPKAGGGGAQRAAAADPEPRYSGSLWNPGQEIRRGNLGPAGGCQHCRALGVTPAERQRIHAGVL